MPRFQSALELGWVDRSELASGLDRLMLARRAVPTATIRTTHMPVHRMAITDRSGLWAEHLSGRAPGITDTGDHGMAAGGMDGRVGMGDQVGTGGRGMDHDRYRTRAVGAIGGDVPRSHLPGEVKVGLQPIS